MIDYEVNIWFCAEDNEFVAESSSFKGLNGMDETRVGALEYLMEAIEIAEELENEIERKENFIPEED